MIVTYRPARSLALATLLVALTACGVPDQTATSTQLYATPSTGSVSITQTPSPTATTTLTLAPTDTAQARATIATELVPAATIVPVSPIDLTLNNISWTLTQPQNVPPRIAANTVGVLWVKFPQMVTNDNIVRYAMDPIPQGDYQLMFTPLQPQGGDVAQNARLIRTIPSRIGNDDVSVVGLSAAGQQHFLFSTYELQQYAQTGGTSRIYWLEPQSGVSKEIVSASVGGGKFLTIAQDDTWLFWNRYEVGTTSLYASGAQAFLFNLETGQSREINLGGANVANSAVWRADGKLAFKTGQEQKEYVFDPTTNQVTAQP